MRQFVRKAVRVSVVAAFTLGNVAGLFAGQQAKAAPASYDAVIEALQEQLAKQQAQIDQLSAQVAEQRAMIMHAREPEPVMVASLAPVAGSTPAAARSLLPTAAPQQDVATKLDDTNKKLDGVSSNLGGFKFSGDFRYRFDGQFRTGNAIAPPLQNARSRYRVRFNTDKEIDPKFKFHLQLSTAPLNNGITNDQDMAGIDVKHPFSIAEAYIDFHPSSRLAFRGGRIEEVFADGMRFLWDDDIRLNGFHQIFTIPFKSDHGGIKSLEFRSGEYVISNPNVQILSPVSPFVGAGYIPGQKVRDTLLFHPGVIFKGEISKTWSHQFGVNIQLYTQPNQVQLASTAAGFPLLINGSIGVTLSGPLTGAGSATTTSGGATFNAGRFQIANSSYRLQHKAVKVAGREMPVFIDIQGSRNVGTHWQRDAVMGTVNFGAVKTRGDFRLLYQFSLKQGNSMISQFTDDDLGTGTGVNTRVHAVRADIGLTKFLQYQNLLFFQHAISVNDAGNNFFVPVQAGANRTYRYLGQLAFTF